MDVLEVGSDEGDGIGSDGDSEVATTDGINRVGT
jgi:hypothetical protein